MIKKQKEGTAVILNVSSDSEACCSYAYVSFEKENMAFLFGLKKKFDAINIDRLHDLRIFDYSPEFLEDAYLDDLGIDWDWPEMTHVAPADLEKFSISMDTVQIHVSRDGIRWSGYVKHGSALLITAEITWKQLRELATFFDHKSVRFIKSS